MFKKFDVNGTGSIDVRELQKLTEAMGLFLGQEELNNAMLDLDANGSGDIDLQEFWTWWQAIVGQVNQKSPVSNVRSTAQKTARSTTDASPGDNYDTTRTSRRPSFQPAGHSILRSRQEKYAGSHLHSSSSADPS